MENPDNTKAIRMILGFSAIIGLGILGMFIAGLYQVESDERQAKERDLSACIGGDPSKC